MKRELTASRPMRLKAPGIPRAREKQFEQALGYIIEQITQRFRNQVFGKLHVSTVNKFQDAQTGNYARVYLRLAASVRRKLVKQFNDPKIEQLVYEVLSKVDSKNREELYARVESRLGYSSRELTNTEGLRADVNALMAETAEWVKRLRDDTIDFYTANSLSAMAQGQSLENVLAGFEQAAGKRIDQARFTARNQIGNFTSLTNKIRAQNLGITQAVWVTSKDERVRPSHKQRDGKVFDLDKGLYSSLDQKTLLPGIDYQCRCDYELIIPED